LIFFFLLRLNLNFTEMIRILFFGPLAEKTNTTQIELNTIPNTVELSKMLLIRYPELRNCRYQMALNHELVITQQDLRDGDEIALLAPFAGG
jgi:molybdopterin converting factor small subunit